MINDNMSHSRESPDWSHDHSGYTRERFKHFLKNRCIIWWGIIFEEPRNIKRSKIKRTAGLWPHLCQCWQPDGDPGRDWTEAAMGPLPSETARVAPPMNVSEKDRKQDQIFLSPSPLFSLLFFSRQAFPWAIFPGRPHYYSTETCAPSEPYGWSF